MEEKLIALFKLICARLDTIHDFFDIRRNKYTVKKDITYFKGTILKALDSTQYLNLKWLLDQLDELIIKPNFKKQRTDHPNINHYFECLLTKTLPNNNDFEKNAASVINSLLLDKPLDETKNCENLENLNEDIIRTFFGEKYEFYEFYVDSLSGSHASIFANVKKPYLTTAWDSAPTVYQSKGSNTIFINPDNEHYIRPELDYIFFSEIDKSRFNLKYEGEQLLVTFNGSNYIPVKKILHDGDINWISVELPYLIKCISPNPITDTCHGCPRLIPSSVSYKNYPEFNFAFDVKRSGDALQRIHCKYLNSMNSGLVHILVTNDYLNYFQACLDKIPVIYLKPKSGAILYKPPDHSYNSFPITDFDQFSPESPVHRPFRPTFSPSPSPEPERGPIDTKKRSYQEGGNSFFDDIKKIELMIASNFKTYDNAEQIKKRWSDFLQKNYIPEEMPNEIMDNISMFFSSITDISRDRFMYGLLKNRYSKYSNHQDKFFSYNELLDIYNKHADQLDILIEYVYDPFDPFDIDLNHKIISIEEIIDYAILNAGLFLYLHEQYINEILKTPQILKNVPDELNAAQPVNNNTGTDTETDSEDTDELYEGHYEGRYEGHYEEQYEGPERRYEDREGRYKKGGFKQMTLLDYHKRYYPTYVKLYYNKIEETA